VALEYGEFALTMLAVEGPSHADRSGWANFAEDLQGMKYWDDTLSPDERRLLCGTYITIDGMIPCLLDDHTTYGGE
jgi:hypothetical protein